MTETGCVIRQAGAIVVKYGVVPKVLLVRAKKKNAQWIFPKGHIRSDETAKNAAVRELLEEGGVKGEPLRQIGQGRFRERGTTYVVDYFLCKYVSTESKGEAGRSPRWYTIEKALQLLTFYNSRVLLKRCAPFLNVVNHKWRSDFRGRQ